MKAVAADLGTSVKRLTAICNHFDIPYPEKQRRRGPQPPLPPRPPSSLDTITITSSTARLSAEIPPVLQTRTVDVAALDRPYHPELKRWLRYYLERRTENSDRSNATDDKIPDGLQRIFKIVNRIFRAAHPRGLVPQMDSRPDLNSFRFIYEGAPIYCELRDTRTRVTVNSLGSAKKELQATGRLLFKILKVSANDMPRECEWHEKKVGRLEDHIEAIVETLALIAPAAVTTHQARLERERLGREEQREALRQRFAAKDEAARRRVLFRAASHYRVARDLRELLAKLETDQHDPQEVIGDRTVTEWIAWGKAQLVLLDPLSEGIVAFFRTIDRAVKNAWQV